jgi:hypothetical protein
MQQTKLAKKKVTVLSLFHHYQWHSVVTFTKAKLCVVFKTTLHFYDYVTDVPPSYKGI